MSAQTQMTQPLAVSLDRIRQDSQPARRIHPLMAVLTFAWRSLLKIKHVPEQLIEVVFAPVMLVLTLTYVFGGAIAGSPEDYLQYALAGIVCQTVVLVTIYTAINVNTDISTGVLDRFRTMPYWRPAHLAGALAADSLRYGLAGSVGLFMGHIIGYRAPGGVLGVLAALGVLYVFSFALSWMWLLVGLKVRTAAAVHGILFVTVFPLTFVSSMYAPPETMPDWLQSFVNVNPLTFLADAVRSLMNGEVDVFSVIMVGMISAGLIAVCAPVALWMYNRA